MKDEGLHVTDCTDVLTGNADLSEDYMRQCAWTPTDAGRERVPQAVDFPMAEAFKDYQQ